MNLVIGLLVPFLGTSLGAACVFFMKNGLNRLVQKALLGFASGVMVAASVWSLLIPSIDMSEGMGKFAFLPAAIGFIFGILFLLLMDKIIPHLHMNEDKPEGLPSHLKKTPCWYWLLLFIIYRREWQSVLCSLDFYQETTELHWREHFHCP